MRIIDDFLSPSYADQIESILDSPNQEWFFNKNISQNKTASNLHYGFSYWIYKSDTGLTQSRVATFLQPMLYQIQYELEKDTLLRCRLDMTVCSGVEVTHDRHVDIPGVSNTTTIYYVSDSDGDTVVYDETEHRVEPKKNRLLVFDGSLYHTGHSPLTHQNRILINSNFA